MWSTCIFCFVGGGGVGHGPGMWKFPGQGLTLYHSSNPQIHNPQHHKGNPQLGFFGFFFGFLLFRAAPTAYGGSQARGPIRDVAASLHLSHSNVGSELHL